MSKLRVLDLFAGIGGFSLGLERTGGFSTVAFCEIEPFPRKVLAKHWPEVFCHHDVTKLTKETLCKGYAENALINQLCKETGGNLASVKNVIEIIKGISGKETQANTTSGPRSAEEALSIITAESVFAAGNPSTHFWQSITSIMTEAKIGKNTRELHGKSLSNADFLTITKFFVTTATWQKPFTVPAHIKQQMMETSHDVRTLTRDILDRDGISVDVITGGFPCQDISTAGKQAGIGEGTRSGLWSEIVRLIGELSPRYVIVENVANLLSGPSEQRGGWFGRILGDLAECGYDAEWQIISAASVGAPHVRKRIWVVAYPASERRAEAGQSGERSTFRTAGTSSTPIDVADTSSKRPSKQGQPVEWMRRAPAEAGEADITFDAMGRGIKPTIRRGDHGFSERMDRLKSLGNAVVPQIPELIGHAILASQGGQS